MKYIALLRGINVGGNNRVPMSELKSCFEAIGLQRVSTYINSGNVLFESNTTDKPTLVRQCEQAILQQFGFAVTCAVIRGDELRSALERAPSWWDDDPSEKHNALFVIAPVTAQQVAEQVGEPKSEYEKIAICEPIIFWSAPIQTFSRTQYTKIVGMQAYQSVTIRNANTTKKLLELCDVGQ